jgi:hypothetical protein
MTIMSSRSLHSYDIYTDHATAKNLPMIGAEVLIILKKKCLRERFSVENRDVSFM